MSAVPCFEDAQRDLATFLASRGHPTQLTWVFREDVHSLRRPDAQALLDAGRRAPPLVAVRLPLPDANLQIAQTLFERASGRGLGVSLVALCRLGLQVACYVWAPRDEYEGMAAMLSPGELKLSIRDPLEDAVPQRSRAAWALSLLRSRLRVRHSLQRELPSRHDVVTGAMAARRAERG